MSRNFNKLDRFISYLRVNKIKKYIKPGSAVCDIGCGDDDLLLRLKKELKLGQAIGVDAHVAAAKKEGVEFLKGDACSLQLADQSCDCVLMLAFIEHIEEKNARQVLREAHRILKSEARLIMTTPTPLAKPVLEFLAFKLKIISQEEIRDHKHYYTRNELVRILSETGYKKVKAKHFQFFMNAFYVFEK